MTNITPEELRIPAHNEQVLRQWDSWRKHIATGGGASWPRDAFEALLDELDLERKLAANEIDRLRTGITALIEGDYETCTYEGCADCLAEALRRLLDGETK